MKYSTTAVYAFITIAIASTSSAGCKDKDEELTDVCGDKAMTNAEECDDGNGLDGDGCANDCTVESGYTCDGAPSVCTDIDECSSGEAPCDANATCANTAGSFTCACESGFTGDGVTCTDTDECLGGAASCDANATCANTAGSFTCTCDSGFVGDGFTCAPIMKTCADVLAQTPGAPDGEYMLFLGGDANKPMTIYCADMANTPAEYLTLPSQTDANFSQYTAGGAAQGTTVRTVYQRIRVDLAELRVITSDQKFSMSQGSLNHEGPVTSVSYAVAMSCDSTPSGVGNVDLTGTPFAVAKDAFHVAQQGTVTYSMNDQIVDLTGGGFCGWAAPKGSYNPFNMNGVPLPLVYIGG